MKGVVFTEFLDFVEDQMGADMVDGIIDDCDLSTGGAYTSVSTYPFSEMQQLVGALAKRSGASPEVLLRAFGRRLCETFTVGHGQYFRQAGSLFNLLSSIDNHIHVEVRKLYPDAELPSFQIPERSEDRMCLDYRSDRGLHELAYGLIEAAADFFAEPIALSFAPMRDDAGEFVRFTLQKIAA